MKKKIFAALFLLAVMVSVSGCAGDSQRGQNKKMNVAVSIYPVYEFAKTVAGDRMNIELIVPPGAEAHDWEPSAKDIKKINSAALVLYNGGGMESWIESIKKNSQDKNKDAFVETGKDLFVTRRDHADPHIWLSPSLAAKQVEMIKEAYIKIDPDGKAVYEKNAEKFISEIKKLDNDYRVLADKSKGKSFITMHAAFGYLADEYGWEQVALLGMAPHAEPGPAQMAKIMRKALEKEVKYIFVESGTDEKIMREVAKEAGVGILKLDTLENAPHNRKSDYIKRMRDNLVNLQKSFIGEK